LLTAGCAFAADLTVTVTELRSDNGSVRLAVFDNARDFPQGEDVTTHIARALRDGVTVLFEGLPAGRYAVAVHHDENDNGKMDTSFVGLPQEGYAFSNGAVAFLGAPPFADAVFELPEEGRHITIEMDY
jgi:uncharacterized protein (DUF2141 family)